MKKYSKELQRGCIAPSCREPHVRKIKRTGREVRRDKNRNRNDQRIENRLWGRTQDNVEGG